MVSEVEQHEDDSASMMDNGRGSSEIAFGIVGGSGREPRSDGGNRSYNCPG